MRSILFILLLTLFSSASAAMPEVMLAERHHSGIDPAEYWVSEKLDGVRALWDGERLYFRSGRPISAPGWFTDGLPPVPLDGELWIGRGQFDRLSGIVRRRTPDDPGWREIRYMIFDLPASPASFTERLQQMESLIAGTGTPWLVVVPQFRVDNTEALMRQLDDIVQAGGEGLMLHHAQAQRTEGRSANLLKLTPWLDAEAEVVAHIPGKGRLEGMLGSLEVEDANGNRFRVGSGFTDRERRSPPPVGAIISYRYRELTSRGLPRFPKYHRIRDLP